MINSDKIYDLIFTWKQGVLPYYKLGRKDYYEEHFFPKSFNYFTKNMIVSEIRDFTLSGKVKGVRLNMTKKEVYNILKSPRYILSNKYFVDDKMGQCTFFYKTHCFGKKAVIQFHFINNRLFSYNIEFRSEIKKEEYRTILKEFISEEIIDENQTGDYSLMDSKGRFLAIRDNVNINITVSVSEFELKEIFGPEYSLFASVLKVA